MTTGIRTVLRFYIKVSGYVSSYSLRLVQSQLQNSNTDKLTMTQKKSQMMHKAQELLFHHVCIIFFENLQSCPLISDFCLLESQLINDLVFLPFHSFSRQSNVWYIYIFPLMFCVSMSLRFFMYVFIATRLAYFAQLHLCSLNIVPLWLNAE